MLCSSAAAGSTLHGKDLARKLAEERPGQPSETGAKNTDRPGRRQARRISGAFPPRDARCEAATARGCRQRTARPWPTPSLPAIARGPARAGRGIAPPSSGRGRRCQRNSSSRRPRPARPRSDLPPRHRRYRTSAPRSTPPGQGDPVQLAVRQRDAHLHAALARLERQLVGAEPAIGAAQVPLQGQASTDQFEALQALLLAAQLQATGAFPPGPEKPPSLSHNGGRALPATDRARLLPPQLKRYSPRSKSRGMANAGGTRSSLHRAGSRDAWLAHQAAASTTASPLKASPRPASVCATAYLSSFSEHQPLPVDACPLGFIAAAN